MGIVYFLINNKNGGKGYLFSRNDEIRREKHFAFHKNDQIRGKEYFSPQKLNSQRKIVFAQKWRDQRKKVILLKMKNQRERECAGMREKYENLSCPSWQKKYLTIFHCSLYRARTKSIYIYSGPIFLIYHVYIFILSAQNF